MDLRMPACISHICRRLEAAGFAAFAVGGCVRDRALGRRPHDWDVATSAPAEDVIRLFRRTAPTGLKYGTVTVFSGGGSAQVTTFRSESGYADLRRPDSVRFISDAAADLARRDFTMNAMAVSADGALLDPFGGMEDIRRKLVRCVGDPDGRFSEDALRMLRALRFSAELGFRIESGTLAAIRRNSSLASAVSAERVRDEITKLLRSDRPEAAADLINFGLISGFLHAQPGENFVLPSALRSLPKNGPFRWCALLAALENAGAVRDAGELAASFRLSAAETRFCASGAVAALELPRAGSGLRLFIAERGADAALAAASAAAGLGDAGAYRRAAAAVRAGGWTDVQSLAVNGADLSAAGFSGRAIGDALRRLSRETTLGTVPNERAALLRRAAGFGKS